MPVNDFQIGVVENKMTLCRKKVWKIIIFLRIEFPNFEKFRFRTNLNKLEINELATWPKNEKKLSNKNTNFGSAFEGLCSKLGRECINGERNS